MIRKSGIVLLFSIGAVAVVHASNPLGDASTFNAFIFGSYQAASDSDAAIAAGGALTGSQNADMSGESGQLGTTTGISIYGGASSNLGGNVGGGNVYLQSGSYSGNLNGGATKHIGANSTLSTAFSTDESYLKNLSTAIAGYTVVSGKAYDFNVNYANQNDAKFQYGVGQSLDLGTTQNLSFNVSSLAANFTVGSVKVYVLDMSASELSALDSHANNIAWTGLDATHNLLINVNGGGSAVTWSPQQQANGDTAYTLYNFTNTASVSTSQIFTGSILATGATIHQGNGDIQGNVIANSLVQTNELHYGSDGNGNYLGYVPAATPEPAPIAALGLGAVLVLRRRKKA